MEITKLQSQTIDYLIFILIVGVVFIHTKDFAPNALVCMQNIDYSDLSGMDIFAVVVRVFSEFIPSLSVPLFFIISGFLFFNKTKDWTTSVYRAKIKGRFQTLLIPYIIWNTLALIALMATPNGFMYYNISTDVFADYTIINYVKGYIIWNGYSPYLNPMWFIRDLFILCLISPIIYFFIKRTKYLWLVLVFINYWLDILPPYLYFTKSPLFFFSLGAFVSILGKNIVEEAQKIRILCCVIFLVSFCSFLYFRENSVWTYISPFYIFSGTIVVVSMTARLLEKGKIKTRSFLTKASFFVFALHQLVILGAWRYLYNVMAKPDSAIEYIIGYFFIPIVTIFTCLLIYYLLQLFFPNVAGLLNGNRNSPIGKKI